jgi:hypothetical protein
MTYKLTLKDKLEVLKILNAYAEQDMIIDWVVNYLVDLVHEDIDDNTHDK